MAHEQPPGGVSSLPRPEVTSGSPPPGPTPVPTQLGFRQWAPFLILLAIATVLGMLFFFVVRSMVMPLFLAAVTAMLGQPIQKRMSKALGERPSLAASLLVIALCVVALLPIAYGMFIAAVELPK